MNQNRVFIGKSVDYANGDFLTFICNPGKANNSWTAGEPGQGTDCVYFLPDFMDLHNVSIPF